MHALAPCSCALTNRRHHAAHVTICTACTRCTVTLADHDGALVALGSFGAGLLGALTGLGGGIVIVPMLTLLFHVDLRYAIGASLVSVIATSSARRRPTCARATPTSASACSSRSPRPSARSLGAALAGVVPTERARHRLRRRAALLGVSLAARRREEPPSADRRDPLGGAAAPQRHLPDARRGASRTPCSACRSASAS